MYDIMKMQIWIMQNTFLERRTAMEKALGFVVFIGFPAIVLTIVLVVLFRVFILPAIVNSGEKKQLITTTTRIISKRENLVGAGTGAISMYYVMFEDCLELRVPKEIYKQINANDLVKLTYIGEKFEELSVIEASGEKSFPKISNTGYFSDTDKTCQA